MAEAKNHRYSLNLRHHAACRRDRNQISTAAIALALMFCTLITWPQFAAAEDEKPADTQEQGSQPAEGSQPTEEAESDEQTAPQPIARVPEREEYLRHQAIPEHLTLFQRNNELVTLVAGEESFYGLFLQERSGQPQGGILILHDQGQHGHWPEYIAPLRENLPDYGWVTFSVALPDPPATPLPPTDLYGNQNTAEQAETGSDNKGASEGKSEESTNSPEEKEPTEPKGEQQAPEPENNKNTEPQADSEQQAPEPDQPVENLEPGARPPSRMADNQNQESETTDTNASSQPAQAEDSPANQLIEARSAHRQQMLERMEQAIAYLNTRGQYNLVVIATGISSSWAVEWLTGVSKTNASGQAEAGLALVLINPQTSSAASIELPTLMKKLRLPILDINVEPGARQQREAKHRLGVMKHAQHPNYRQVQLNTPVTRNASKPLVRQVRGWLKRNAAGTEIGR